MSNRNYLFLLYFFIFRFVLSWISWFYRDESNTRWKGKNMSLACNKKKTYRSFTRTSLFSHIVKVKSLHVWDVICSTLVLYRSMMGSERALECLRVITRNDRGGFIGGVSQWFSTFRSNLEKSFYNIFQRCIKYFFLTIKSSLSTTNLNNIRIIHIFKFIVVNKIWTERMLNCFTYSSELKIK